MAKILSIEISNSLVRICEMDHKKNNPRVYRHAMVITPPGAINDGYLIKMDELKNVIKKALEDNQMKTKDVIFTIASSKIVSREVMLPALKPAALSSLIRTNLNEYFPIDLSSYEIAHQVLEQMSSGTEKGKYRTLIMAAEKGLIEGYDKLASLCGLRLVSLDHAGNSIFQAIKNEATTSRVMVLKIEENQTMISIVKDKSLMLQRNINYGLSEAIHEVMKQSIFDMDNYDDAWNLLKIRTCVKFNVSEVAQKNERNKDLSTDLETRDYDENQAVREAKIQVTKSLEPLINGIRRVVEFYSSRNNGEEVDRVYITGFGGGMSGLAKLLTNELGIKTSVLNRLEGVAYHVTNQDAGIYNFVSCIGATFEPVGFISKEKKSKEKKETDYTLTTILVIAAAAVLNLCLIVISVLGYKEETERETLLKKNEQIYMEAEKIYKEYTNVETFLTQLKEAEGMVKRPNDNILNFLNELEQVMPSEGVVTEFESDDEQLLLSVKVPDKEVAAKLIANFREFDSIMHVSVEEVVEAEEPVLDEDGVPMFTMLEDVELPVVERVVKFTITAIYYPVVVDETATETTAE